jgi:serine/threonine protein kinase
LSTVLVMQYVEGLDLEARLEKGNAPLSLEEIHGISWDVLSALDYVHTLGLVHLDVKPANMLLAQNDRTLLMNFGIAKALHEQRKVTLGTPDYMSPEQIVCPSKVDGRSDIYSFGCVLYAMLTGRPPFDSDFGVSRSGVPCAQGSSAIGLREPGCPESD